MIRFLLFILAISSLISCASKNTHNKELTIVSYNIRHGQGMDGLVDIKRTATVLELLDADLIALQEVDKFCPRSGNIHIAKELAKLLGMEFHFEKFMDYQGGEYGMAVLSRFPIEKTIRHQLPKGTEPRCALEIQVKVPAINNLLSFICIHNEWRKGDARKAQVKTLLDAINHYHHPTILAGDFNATPDDPSIALLKNTSWLIMNKSGEKTYPSHKPEKEIDFIMSRNLNDKSASHFVVNEQVASDHRPIVAEIHFEK
ncbi:endonuclease/exonuclease/phosphatase family protein [Lentisphaera profundi]|uniref:Endonuclease/exonuclease/phosphatase family protein n=1 Tax=Lentisphaera profundi TaxID=1658616 RepID=A0ABY7VV51_9BACT|nr:endonuclease/exonuclease/phosphatase family protein [Lentisphaera profundi]WDE97639.1 endonuclease/exonuclease/phosphatase family protein [Lentisphaera profundi]